MVLDAYVFGSYVYYIRESWVFTSRGLDTFGPWIVLFFDCCVFPPADGASVSYDLVVYRPASQNSSSVDAPADIIALRPYDADSLLLDLPDIHSSMDTDNSAFMSLILMAWGISPNIPLPPQSDKCDLHSAQSNSIPRISHISYPNANFRHHQKCPPQKTPQSIYFPFFPLTPRKVA